MLSPLSRNILRISRWGHWSRSGPSDRFGTLHQNTITRLASRFSISEEVFRQEVGFLRSRRQWIKEQQERVTAHLDGLEQGFPGPEALTMLNQLVSTRLGVESCQDRRFIFDALGVTIIAHGDGTWDLELEIPKEASQLKEPQIENVTPRLGWG